MVLEKSTALAMRCPTCGRLKIDQLNIFQLSGNRVHEIYCDCGSKKMSVQKKGSDHITLKYYCIICNHEHKAILPAQEFWSRNKVGSLLCHETKLNLGYYGPYELIKEKLKEQQKELDSMANDLGFDDFADPEVMLAILDYLHDIAAQGNLFCECGSHDINVDLSSDKIKLSCNNCGTTRNIPAENRQDLEMLKEKGELMLNMSVANKNKTNPKDPWINI
ncbi:MAG: hypothetical protein ACOCRO_02495 [Halanaerobiales bacterium]